MQRGLLPDAKLGWRDIVVVDQGPLFETGGSTSHAPGLVFQINPSKTMTSLARATVDLWSQLELGGVPCVNTVGSLEVAWTPERLADLKRKVGYGLSWGVEAHLLGGAEARGLFPMLSERVLGAIYVPSDIQTNATRPAEAMARAAERNGAAFHGNVKVTGFGIADGRIAAVRTTQGDIKTDLVVSAVGIWAPRLGADLPACPCRCRHCSTSMRLPRRCLTWPAAPRTSPCRSCATRTSPCISARWARPSALAHTATNPWLWKRMTSSTTRRRPSPRPRCRLRRTTSRAGWRRRGKVLPSLEGAGLTRKFNGLFSFTTDGFPVLGESPQVRGFWSAQAVWITHAGGIGKAVAEWIVNGEPTIDLRECDIRRFHPHALSRPYVRARAAQQYREVYDIIHPRQQATNPRNIRLTPFYARQRELGAVFFENAGWERPQWFDANHELLDSLSVTGELRAGWAAREWSPTVAAEHVATRVRAALFDLSPFAKFEVTGRGALAALQRLASNQMDKPVGSITYTPMLTPSGGIKCDLTIMRLGGERFLVVTAGSTGLSRPGLDPVASAG